MKIRALIWVLPSLLGSQEPFRPALHGLAAGSGSSDTRYTLRSEFHSLHRLRRRAMHRVGGAGFPRPLWGPWGFAQTRWRGGASGIPRNPFAESIWVTTRNVLPDSVVSRANCNRRALRTVYFGVELSGPRIP